MGIPKYHQLFNPVLDAMHQLGGSATIAEMNDAVLRMLELCPEESAQQHDAHSTEIEYRLAWARTYLKAYGLLGNSSRGVWVLTDQGRQSKKVDERAVVRLVRNRRAGPGHEVSDPGPNTVAAEQQEEQWRDVLTSILLSLKPDAFERLCQRILRESGFVQVRVTGRTGDGGIDGVGLVQLGGLLSFPVLFQCKRYRGSVGAGAVRDFRGAIIGRADRGLMLTTGSFTQDARTEATRDGAPPIDLVDGDRLMDKLKELRLGVNVQMIEKVEVDNGWFTTI